MEIYRSKRSRKYIKENDRISDRDKILWHCSIFKSNEFKYFIGFCIQICQTHHFGEISKEACSQIIKNLMPR